MKHKARHLLTVAALGVLAAALSVTLAAPDEGDPVAEINVAGNEQMSRGAVLSFIKTRVGQSFAEEMLREDKQRLIRTRRFERVDVSWERTDAGVVVTIEVSERPLIQSLNFEGNKEFTGDVLAKELAFGVGDAADRFRVEAGRQAILTLYHSKGYYQAAVTVDAEALADNRVVYRIVEGPQVTIDDIVFEGRVHFSKWKLSRQIGINERFWPFVPGYLDTEQVERDVLAIRNLYLSEGFLDVEVGRRYDFSPDKEEVVVVFLIKPGPRYRVNEFVFRGNTVFSDRELIGRIAAGGGLESREYYSTLALRRTAEAVENTYGELGYINASVEVKKLYLAPTRPLPDWASDGEGESAVLNVLVIVNEADQYRVGAIHIRGNDVTQSRVIRRELRFYPEQLFNTVAVQNSRQRLLETRLFDKVTLTPTGQAEDVRNVLVQVDEAKTAEFLVGVGVSTNSGLLGNISFTQRNFDLFGWPTAGRKGPAFRGAGQTLRVVAEPGTELMRFYVDWEEPYLFDLPYSLGTKAFLFNRGRESYDEMRYGGVASVGHRFRNRWYGELAGTVQGVEVDDLDSDAPSEVVEDEGTHGLVSMKGTLVRDRTDSRWMPSAGDRFRLSYEQFVGDDEFGVSQADYRIYRTLHVDALDRKHILSGRFSAGYIFGDSPIFERFYGGGIGSIRGFEYRGVGPRGTGGDDDPIGGEFMTFVGAQYGYPIIGEQLRGVVFLDTGTVEENFEVTTWRASVGAGVRWIIPMFGPVPMSLDFAVPIAKDGDDDEQIVSFSFGWTF